MSSPCSLYTLKVVPIIDETMKEAKYFICVVYHQALSNLPVASIEQHVYTKKQMFKLKSNANNAGYI